MRATDPQPHRAGPLRPPGAPLGTIPRPALAARLGGDERVVLVVAPPGYGKTEATRQWSELQRGPVGWLAIDLLDEAPAHFWRHLVQALGDVVDGLDDEPLLLLAERGPADPIFLDALIEQVERAGRGGALVVDDAWRLTEPSVLAGLALLVARIGHLVRFVVIDRADPPFPTALWRSRGWVAEVRADALRFTDEEAIRVAAELPGLTLSDAAVAALNGRAEGWPIGLHLALVSISSEPEPESRAHAIASSDRLLLDYLVSEVLDALPADLRDVALALSVLRWFDSDLCVELLGEAALPAADELRRRRLFLTTVDHGSTDSVRFHQLFRELLENELRWRVPARRVDLHRRAAGLWRERGDLISAHHHLIAIGDIGAATALVLPVATELVDHGGVTTLAEHMRRMPEGMHVDDADRAFDLAQAWTLAGGEDEAVHWCAVAEHLSAGGPAERMRGHSTAAAIDLLQGSIASAWEHVERFDPLAAGEATVGPVERQFPTVGARVALVAGRREEARVWIDRAAALGRLQEPPALERVVVPALRAWWELEGGELDRAGVEADAATDEAERLGLRPHLGALDALVVAVRCRIGRGQLREADELMELVRADAAQLGWTMPRIAAGLLAAEVARLRTGPSAALATIEELRRTISPRCPATLELWLASVEAAAFIGCARFADAGARVERLDGSPRSRLLRARLAVARGAREPVAPLVCGREGWGTRERLEADVLVALGDEPGDAGEIALVAALAAGDETGWVSPFLDVAAAVEQRLGALRVEQLHPALAEALRALRPDTGPAVPQLVEPLTPRELTLLELLPTHLSYAEIGDRLYLSVNTIKSNLKAIYRKLDVTSRTDAVETAWRLGLLEAVTPAGGPSAAGTRPRR